MECAACDHPNPQGSGSCLNCGDELTASSAAADTGSSETLKPAERLADELEAVKAEYMTGQAGRAFARVGGALEVIEAHPELLHTISGAALIGFWGLMCVFRARLHEATVAIERAVTVAREAELTEVIGWTLGWRAMLLMAQGELEPAIANGCRSIELAEQQGNAFSLGSATLGLSSAYLLNQTWGEALELCKKSVEDVRRGEAGLDFEPYILVSLGKAQLGLGETAAARDSVDRGLALAQERDLPLTVSRGLMARAAWVLHTQGTVARPAIQDDLDAAEAIAKESGTLLWLPRITRLRAHVFAAYGDFTSARHHLERAVKAYYEMGAVRSGERLTDELTEKW